MKHTNRFVATCGIVIITVICAVLSVASSQPTTAPSTSISALPQFDAQLPPGEARNIVMVRCATCHTAHYILNQPPFSRKVWTAEVTKMKTAFAAPIPDDDAAKIIDYLVAVRGDGK